KSNLLHTQSQHPSPFVNPVPVVSSTSEETDADDGENEDTSLETDWDTAINEWEELLIEEEFEEEQDDLDDAEIDFLNSDTHPAENQAAKWKLQNLFLPNLPFPVKNI
ncbi:22614_t:CDS:1, partial [Gigaspora rosea]